MMRRNQQQKAHAQYNPAHQLDDTIKYHTHNNQCPKESRGEMLPGTWRLRQLKRGVLIKGCEPLTDVVKWRVTTDEGNNMSDTIRVGLIGYGYASKTFHAPLISGTPGMELAAVSSSDEAKVKVDWPGVKVVSEPKHLFNDPSIDLIVIPTPNDTHFPLAKAALEAGKHVVVDKPFTVTLSQARELDALARSLGRLLSVFHNRRWDSDFLTVKALIAEGTLGEVTFFESHFDRYRPEVRNRWREQGGPGSGIWYDLAPHLLDQAVNLFGLPVSLTVDLAQLRPGAQSTDYFHAVLNYPQRRELRQVRTRSAGRAPEKRGAFATGRLGLRHA
jgi:predicted dehydrogenase